MVTKILTFSETSVLFEEIFGDLTWNAYICNVMNHE